MIKRIILESDLNDRPFKEGETLWSYARRIVREVYSDQECIIRDIDTRVDIIDVSTRNEIATTVGKQTVEIEIAMKVNLEEQSQ